MTTKTEPRQPAKLWVALIAETIVGLVLGTVTAVLGGIICALLLHWTGLDNQLGMGSLGLTLYAGLFGFALGASVGVASIGRWLQQGGNFWLALLGAMAALVLLTALMRRGLSTSSEILFIIPVLLSLVFAVLGYNLQRHSTL